MPAIRDTGQREDMWVLRLTIAGEDWGIWDKKTGGDQDSDATLYYPGGMKDAQDLGGRATPSNITLQRLCDRNDDWPRINKLTNGAGRATFTLSQRPMDKDANEFGKTLIWTGTIKRALAPNVDNESSAAAMVEIELIPRGKPALV